tara:strand:- start:4112 stop:4402 length:291 start_codon:yes stop_codon:yes gene_type:complete
MPNKIRFFFTVDLRFLNLNFHNFVLFSEFKYNLLIMQLRLRPRASRSIITRNLIVKIILFAVVLLLAIFLLDKIDIPAPSKLIKQELSNDKIITVK